MSYLTNVFMNDLDFLLLSKHIFENKSVEYPFCSQMVHVRDWLNSIDPDHLENKNFNREKEIVIDLKLEDMDRVIDLLNTCNPSIGIKIIVNDSNDNLISKRLNVTSHSLLTFDVDEELVFKPGRIHGGELIINGNVDSTDLLSVLKAAPVSVLMRTSIKINGFVTNSKSFCETLFEFLTEVVQKTNDIHNFSIFISGNTVMPAIPVKNEFSDSIKTKIIRNWEIISVCKSNGIKMTVSKIHNLL